MGEDEAEDCLNPQRLCELCVICAKLIQRKISRKESKESRFFLRLLDCAGKAPQESERTVLVTEASEFIKIFSAILRNSE